MQESNKNHFGRAIIALVAFGMAFGYVETAVVVYLRTINEPVRQAVLAGQPHDEVFPLLSWADARMVGTEYPRIVLTELAREFATLVMLAAIGLAVGRSGREWLAGFMVALGVWDVFYYVFLKLLLGWPASLWTWDILFLLPVPWAAPVLAPVLVAAAMVPAGITILWRESVGRPARLGWLASLLMAGGGLTIVVAFCWDFRNISAGGMPNPFNWPLFGVGGAIALAGLAWALWPPHGSPSPQRHEAGG